MSALVGYWDYDELMPVHYINISRDYADDIEAQAVKTGLQPLSLIHIYTIKKVKKRDRRGKHEPRTDDIGLLAGYGHI